MEFLTFPSDNFCPLNLGWEKFSDPNCQKCNGSGFLSNSSWIPCGPWPCSCCYNDEKYQPLGKENADIIFLSEGEKVKAIHYWYKQTDPLIMSAPYREIWEILATIEISQYPTLTLEKKWYPKDKKTCFEICQKIVRKEYTVNFTQNHKKNNGKFELTINE